MVLVLVNYNNYAITHISFIRIVSQLWNTLCLLSHRAVLKLLWLSFNPLQWLWPLECVRERRGRGNVVCRNHMRVSMSLNACRNCVNDSEQDQRMVAW